MKLMTYNILDGGRDLSVIIEIVKGQNPDILVLNEANGFELNGKLESFAKATGFPNYHLALSGEYDYHAAIFSQFPFKRVKEIRPLKRAGILVLLDTEWGETCVLGTHLSPHNEDERVSEINLILSEIKAYPNKILMGDMNSLARNNNYPVSMFSEKQAKKFVANNKIRSDVTDAIASAGLVDVAITCHKNDESTVPTPVNRDPYHANLRLDYIFVSESLKDRITDYIVLKNVPTDRASDHYPVVTTLINSAPQDNPMCKRLIPPRMSRQAIWTHFDQDTGKLGPYEFYIE